MKNSGRVYQLDQALIIARKALRFYADLKYSDEMGLPPDVQWVAEKAIEQIDKVLPKVKDQNK